MSNLTYDKLTVAKKELLLFLAEKFDEKSIRQIHFNGKRPSTTFDQKFDKPLGNHIYHKF
jgi:hypothetical protein